MHDIDENTIRDHAYRLWERAGQPEGREQHFWFEAERELAAEQPPKAPLAEPVKRPVAVPGGLG